MLKLRSDYCTVDGAGIVPYNVTKHWRTKAFKSVVMVGTGQGKSREGLRVSIRVRVVIRHAFHLPSHITNLKPSAIMTLCSNSISACCDRRRCCSLVLKPNQLGF